MNIAFVTVILLIIILPGISFHRGYYSGEFSRNYIQISLINFFFSGLVPAVFFHTLGYYLTLCFSPLTIDLVKVGCLVTGNNSYILIRNIFESIENKLFSIVSYNFLLCFFAWICGTGCRKIIRKFHFDILFGIFRFSNRYYYLFNSEFMDIQYYDSQKINSLKKLYLALFGKEIMKFSKKIDLTVADVLVQVGEEVYIYKGFVETFYMNKESGLDRIILKYATRRKIMDDPYSKKETNKNIEKRYYEIPGTYLLIPYKSIININLDYYTEKDD